MTQSYTPSSLEKNPSPIGTGLKAILKVIWCMKACVGVILIQHPEYTVENREEGLRVGIDHVKDVNKSYLKGRTEPHISKPLLLSAMHCRMKQIVNSPLHLNPLEIYSSLATLSTTSGANRQCSWGHQMPVIWAFGSSFIPQWAMLQHIGTGLHVMDYVDEMDDH